MEGKTPYRASRMKQTGKVVRASTGKLV